LEAAVFPTKFAHLAADLGREFSRRADHEGLQLASLHLNTLQDRQGEGSGLAASCLRLTNDIPAGKQGRNRFNLNGCWLSVAEVLDHGGQGGG
jgi:hypothetical protein